MMIIRPSREPHITRSNNKLNEWLIIVVVTCYLFSVTTDAHERFVVKVVVRHGFFGKFICFGIFRSSPTVFFKVFNTIRNRGKISLMCIFLIFV